MADELNVLGWTEKQFHLHLVKEAARDVVFLMEIEHQLRNGFGFLPDELPHRMENAVLELLKCSAQFGFGEPGTSSWNRHEGLSGAPSEVAEKIVEAWCNDREHYRFLAFIRERNSGV